jgi:hypothetical protein
VTDNPILTNNDPNAIYPTKGHNVDMHDGDDDDDDEVADIGEEYILGTMMVRVLQARHVKVCVFIPSIPLLHSSSCIMESKLCD